MPNLPSRLRPLFRVFTLIAALLIAVQVAIPPAAAAPARQDDELTVAPSPHEDEEAAEPAEDADEEVAEPGQGEDEHAAEPLPEDDAEGGAPAMADDEPDHVEEAAAPEPVSDDEAAAMPAPVEAMVAAAPAYDDDPVADGFLLRLLDAINARRARTGTQRLSYVPARANSALDGFLAQTIPAIRWPGPCGHHLVGGAFSWDYVLASGFGGDPRGEVIACPGPEPYWTPDRAAEQWWLSPVHFDVLYADGYSNSIACSAQGVSRGSNEGGKNRRRSGGSSDAASAVLCVTFHN